MILQSFSLRARPLRSLLALLAGLALAPAAGADPRNLLANPGFEEGVPGHPWMPAGWDTSRADLPTVFFGRDTSSVHGGQYAVNVASASSLYPMAHNWSQLILVNKEWWGQDLVFSVWTRSIGVEGRAYIKVDAYQDTITKMARIWKVSRDDAATRLGYTAIDDPILDLGWKRKVFTDPETDWVHREARVYLAPTTNVVFVRCGVIGTGQLMLDDASLTLEPALPTPPVSPKTNLLADPGFEKDGTDWEYSMPPFPDMKAEQDSAVVHSGKFSLRMSSPPTAILQGKTGVCQVICNRNLGSTRLRLTGFIKADSLMSSAFLKLHCHSISGERQAASPEIISGTTGWIRSTVELETPPDTYEVWAWFTYLAPTKGIVHFDDARLEVVGRAGSTSGSGASNSR